MEQKNQENLKKLQYMCVYENVNVCVSECK